MEFIIVLIVIVVIIYLISKNDQGAVIQSSTKSTKRYYTCRTCKKKLSEQTHKYEIHSEDGNLNAILCDSCYPVFMEEFQSVTTTASPQAKVLPEKTKQMEEPDKDVLEYLDAAAKEEKPVRIIYHSEKDSRERMILPTDVRDEFDPSISRRQYICLEENIFKNFLQSKMEIITEDGEIFGLGKKHQVKKYSSTYEVKQEILKLRPELEEFIDISDTHLQFKIIGKRGKFLKYPRFGLEYADHREHRPWAAQTPETTTYYKHLDKAANFLVKNIEQFNIQRDFHS